MTVALLIIAILAAIAVFTMSPTRTKAIVNEVEIGLGLVRAAVRQYYAEFTVYPGASSGTAYYVDEANRDIFPGLVVRPVGGNYGVSLDGAYTGQECYSFRWAPNGEGYVRCDTTDGERAISHPPQWDTTVKLGNSPDGWAVYMNILTGQFFQRNISASGLPQYNGASFTPSDCVSDCASDCYSDCYSDCHTDCGGDCHTDCTSDCAGECTY